ncbi:MAG: hypothetical protein OXM02_05260, partial [Bacteroidota bacterium]|nr:hypothetical protein [Bacteroidota bacterium]
MNPKDLRKVVAGLLKRYGFKLHLTHNAAAGTDWLNWTNTDLSDAERKLGGGDLSLWWGMTFKPGLFMTIRNFPESAPRI